MQERPGLRCPRWDQSPVQLWLQIEPLTAPPLPCLYFPGDTTPPSPEPSALQQPPLSVILILTPRQWGPQIQSSPTVARPRQHPGGSALGPDPLLTAQLFPGAPVASGTFWASHLSGPLAKTLHNLRSTGLSDFHEWSAEVAGGLDFPPNGSSQVYVLGWEAWKSLGTPGHPQKAGLREKFPGPAGVTRT